MAGQKQGTGAYSADDCAGNSGATTTGDRPRRPRSLRQISEEFIAAHPDPSDPVAHTLSVYADEPDEAFVIVASGNVYGVGVRTGLTWGDLRRLAGLR